MAKKISDMSDEELQRRALELAEKEHRRETIRAKLKLIELIAIAAVIIITIIAVKVLS